MALIALFIISVPVADALHSAPCTAVCTGAFPTLYRADANKSHSKNNKEKHADYQNIAPIFE